MKPIVYLFTDGKPTDSTASQVARWKKSFAHRAQLIAIALGDTADTSTLKELTPHVFLYNQSGSEPFKKFIQWISLSVSMQSRSVESNDAVVAPRELSLLKEVPAGGLHSGMDDTCVVLVGRCQQSKRPYLVKYERAPGNERSFVLTGTHPLDESYFEWSGKDSGSDLKVSVDLLQGTPACPHCDSPYAIAACACGQLFCCNGPGRLECPWCRNSIELVASESTYDIGRRRG